MSVGPEFTYVNKDNAFKTIQSEFIKPSSLKQIWFRHLKAATCMCSFPITAVVELGLRLSTACAESYKSFCVYVHESMTVSQAAVIPYISGASGATELEVLNSSNVKSNNFTT